MIALVCLWIDFAGISGSNKSTGKRKRKRQNDRALPGKPQAKSKHDSQKWQTNVASQLTNVAKQGKNNKKSQSTSMKVEEQGDDFRLKMSKNKLSNKRDSRLKQGRARKNVMKRKLKQMGYDVTNMSFTKQQKLLLKIMQREKNDEKQNEEINQAQNNAKQRQIDIDLILNDSNNVIDENVSNTRKNKNKKNKKAKNSDGLSFGLDLDFGEISKTNEKESTMIENEFYGRNSLNNSKNNNNPMQLSDRKLLKKLKKDELFLTQNIKENTLKRLKGEKIDYDVRSLKKKLKEKQRKKRKSQREWRQRLKRKQLRINKKQQRRNDNISNYIERKVNRKIGKSKRLSTDKLIMAADV